jgi:Carboxypeptidase regulatory-like domain
MLACALFCPARAAYGYCAQPYSTVRCEFLNSDAVFVGTVLSVRVVPFDAEPTPPVPISFTDINGWVYELSVQRMFRGPRTKTITVFTTNDDARVMLKKGETVLLFASDVNRVNDPKLTSQFDSQFEIFDCGNSTLASKARAAIRELEKMKVPEDAEIEGQVSDHETGAPVSGIQVVIQGEGKSFQAISDRDGWFHVQVAPGEYSAKASHDPRWSVVPSPASFDDPNEFTARTGRCSGLQFSATSR